MPPCRRFPPLLGLAAACFLLVLSASCAGAARGRQEPSPAAGGQGPRTVPPRQEFEGTVIEWNLVRLSTRPDVRLDLLVGRPQGMAKRAVLLFTGGDGTYTFRKLGDDFRLSGNFLVRSAPLFAREGLVAVIVDTPSDHASGMGDDFRTSPEHATDVQAAVDHLAKEGIADIYLIGTSRGTLSVGYLATRIKHPQVKGFVLTSSMDTIAALPLAEIAVPVLFVHHAADGCRASTYSGARASYSRLTKRPGNHFLSVSGGDTPISGPCEALSAHGYLGKEREVIRAISLWIKGEPAPAQINP